MTPPSNVLVPLGLKRGDRSPGVRVLQEWLTWWRTRRPTIPDVGALDGDFGAKTEAALIAVTKSATVTEEAKDALEEALYACLAVTGDVATIAQVYCEWGVCEVGGNNRGPWVRLLTGGLDGDAYRWCGYFARHVARQAGATHAELLSPSCDTTVAQASKAGRIVKTPARNDVFVKYRTAANGTRDYYHMGIVSWVWLDGRLVTYEGNSNDDGSANGTEVALLGVRRASGPYVFVRVV